MPEGVGPVDPVVFAAAAAALLSSGLLLAALRPQWVVGQPRMVLALLLAVTLAAVAGSLRLDPLGLRLEIDPSTEPLLPRGDPGIASYRQAVRDYGDDQVFVIAMECEDVFRYEQLAALRRVSDAISRIDGVRRVQSLVRVTSFRYVPEQDWIEVQPFIDEIPSDAAALAELRRRALDNPVYRRVLVSEDGRSAALNVSFREMTDSEFIAGDYDGRIRAILDAESAPGRRFHVSGRPHIKARMYHTMIRDLRVLVPLVIAVVALVLALVEGTLRGVVLPMVTVSMGVVWTFGAMAFLERPLTVLTVLLAPALIAIGSVYGVHVVHRYDEEEAAGGRGREVALRCLRLITLPVLIAGFTTMVGYAALLITDVPAVFEVGAFAVLGVASITLISMTGIPAVLALRRPRRAHGAPDGRIELAGRFGRALDAGLAQLTRLAIARPGPVLAVWMLLALGSAAVLPRMAIDTDYMSFFDEHAQVRRDFDAINRLLSGAVPLYVVLEGGRPGSFREPELLRAVERLQTRIEALPGVSSTLSFLVPLRRLNRALERDDPAQERIPDSRAGVSELLFMLPKDDLARFSTVDQSGANLIVRTGEVGSAAIRSLVDGIQTALDDGTLPPELRARVTGNALLLNRAADGVARSQPRTVGLAALTILLLLALGLRSPRLGLVAMVPNIVPVLIFFGLLGAGAAPLSLPTSLIGSVALGIAIDATAHYLVRYRAERMTGCSPEEAVTRTSLYVGRPVAIAALMLTLGFLSVCFSEFATLRQFGWLSAFTMAVCGLCDLLLLPALLLRLRI